ncbi:MaoC/PaaZ C-terminal domain-containing protein [Rhodococcus sp. NPDC056506]|uniref:MaoC/PaaZ C-terminal domain-containing protein n=1 Tax=Rhodococcus sp. NPDC056506 TaxID=3345844 RepID=UPI00366CBDF7
MTTTTETVVTGQQAESKTFPPLTRTDFVKYQGASGDFHPLHHDDAFARETGFPSVFSVGMLQAGMLAGYVTEWLGVENLRRFKIRFADKVWPGDELTCSAVVVDIYEAEDGRRARVELVCARQNGVNALVGDAEFLID